MEEYILLSHNDLDGAGCSIVLNSKFHIDTTFHTNYQDIVEKLKGIDEIITHHTRVVFITDLNFDENSFIELVRLSMNHQHVKFIYIDHHVYEGKSLELFNKIKKLENVHIKHDTTKCATQLCYDFINSNDPDLGRLVTYINAYDIYLEDQVQNFKVGFMLNTIFWAIKLSAFKFNVEQNNYKIPKYFLTMYAEMKEKKEKAFKHYEKQGLIVQDEENHILLAFSDDYKAFYVHDYPDFQCYILPYQSSNNISVRLKNCADAEAIRDEILEFVNTYPNTISAGGHPFAFGITIATDAPKDDVFMIIDTMVKIVSAYTNPQKEYDYPELKINEDEIPF
ncbi:MAG: hypothetical protein KAI79_14035 [Bacteroidales bacterium]|nr:hypothetical protein [Bacteroidales bacterium]